LLALRHLIDQDLSHAALTLESDCQTLIETLKGQRSPPWQERSLFSEAAFLLSFFPNISLAFCRREANVAADWAAKAHRVNSKRSNWAVFPPPPLLDLIYADAIAAACNRFGPYI